MASTSSVVLSFNLDDNASPKLDNLANKTNSLNSKVDRVTKSLRLQEIELRKGKDAMVRARAALDGANLSQIREIKNKQKAIAETVAKRQAEEEAARAQQESTSNTNIGITAVDRMVRSLELQRVELEQGKDAMFLHKAAMEGATTEQLDGIRATQAAIAAKKQEIAAEQAAAAAKNATETETDQTNLSIQRLIQSLEIEEVKFRESGEAALIYKARLDGATEEQIQHIQTLYRSIDAHKDHAQALTAGGRQARYMRGMTGQLGHQIQDVAVQMQMGTNGLLVFAQQGSQIASLMGPSGAVVGAFLAVGAAISMAFIPQTEKATKVTRDYGDELKELAKTTQSLSEIQKRALMAELTADILAQKRELERLSELQVDATRGNEMLTQSQGIQQRALNALKLGNAQYAGTLAAVSYAMKIFGGDADANTKALEQNDNNVSEATKTLKELQRQLAAIANGENPFFEESVNESTNAVESFIESLRDKNNTLGMSARTLDIYRAVQAMVKDGNYENAQAIYAEINAYHDRLEAMRETNTESAIVKSATDAYVASLQQQIDTLDMSDREMAVYRANQAMIADGNWKNAASIYNLIDAYYDEVEALDKAAQAERERQQAQSDFSGLQQGMMSEIEQIKAQEAAKLEVLRKAQELNLESVRSYEEMRRAIIQESEDQIYQIQAQAIERQLNDQLRLIGGFEGMKDVGVDAISAIIKEGASMSDVFKMVGRAIVDNVIESIVDMGVEYVKQMLIQKQIQAAGTAAATATAVASGATIATAMAPAAALTSLATMGANAAPAMAGISSTAALTSGLALASFEGGGFTGTGSRSGGLDGKGGFMAMVHPNETVVDHTKGQTGGVTIINNVDASGGGADVDQKIRVAMEVTSQQTVMQVQDLLRRQRLV